MSAVSYAMPSDVQVDATGDHVRYLLPRRQLRAIRFVRLLPMGMACRMLRFLFGMLNPIKRFASADRASRIFTGVLCVFFLRFIMPALRLMIDGLIIVAAAWVASDEVKAESTS